MRASGAWTRATWLAPAALALLAVQGFHVVEHVLQTYQKYALGHPQAHGLLGRYLDSDALHFAFNAGLFAALVVLARVPGRGATWRLFQAGVVAQGYHTVEHTVKLAQSALLGHDPALGILGHWYELVPLHLVLNAVCYALIVPHLAVLLARSRTAVRPARTSPEA